MKSTPKSGFRSRDVQRLQSLAEARMLAADRRHEVADERMAQADALIQKCDEVLRASRIEAAEMLSQLDRLSQQLAIAINAERAAGLEAASYERRMHEQANAAVQYLNLARQREHQLELTFNSVSWRITVPLRRLKRGFLKAFNPKKSDVERLWNEAAPPPRKLKPSRNIFLEVTHTYHSDLNTGIQRVVRNVLRHAGARAKRLGYRVIPVMIDNGRFRYADRHVVLRNKIAVDDNVLNQPSYALRAYRRGLSGISSVLPGAGLKAWVNAPSTKPGLTSSLQWPFRLLGGVALSFLSLFGRSPKDPPPPLDSYASHEGHLLILLDSSWTVPIWNATRDFRNQGGKVVGVIYDLIPVTHPHTSVENLTVLFREWLEEHLQNSDGFVAISGTVARQIRDYAVANNAQRIATGAAPVSHFLLGSELDFSAARDAREHIVRMFSKDNHVFLVVGTIEPRKNHDFVLKAFEQFWALGHDAKLIICGRGAWKTEELLSRIAKHPMLNDKLFVVRDAADEELTFMYEHASALIMASEIEGFGLPIVEAFQRGLPVICSDIPVFNEIAVGKASFFSLSHVQNLVDEVVMFCNRVPLQDREKRVRHDWITWKESAAQLIDAAMTVAGMMPKGR